MHRETDEKHSKTFLKHFTAVTNDDMVMQVTQKIVKNLSPSHVLSVSSIATLCSAKIVERIAWKWRHRRVKKMMFTAHLIFLLSSTSHFRFSRWQHTTRHLTTNIQRILCRDYIFSSTIFINMFYWDFYEFLVFWSVTTITQKLFHIFYRHKILNPLYPSCRQSHHHIINHFMHENWY